jgi:hypothetical protein
LSWSRKDKTGAGSMTYFQFYMEGRSAIAQGSAAISAYQSLPSRSRRL